MHETKRCMLTSGLDVEFGRTHANIGEWLWGRLEFGYSSHVKIASTTANPSPGSANGSSSVSNVAGRA